MSEVTANMSHEIAPVEVDALKLDLENPRFIGMRFENEAEMIAFLDENADLSELLLSILNSGYLDFEPIVVRRGDSVVLEGNRRVAALKLIRHQQLRQQLHIKLPAEPNPEAMPAIIRAVLVENANEARSYIGFKHINGPRKWDAMSKAKYAADWYAEGASLEEISKGLGDTFNTVNRLVHGYRVYQQAIEEGFDPEKRTARRFAFSHLYTAITRSSIKQWLDLNEGAVETPVPPEKADRLLQLMSWLYGQGDDLPALVRTQNPDLNRLADVMAHERTREILLATRDLGRAWEELEPQSARLESALIQAVRQTEAASALAGSFDGRESTYELGQRLFNASRTLFKSFRDYRERQEGLDEL